MSEQNAVESSSYNATEEYSGDYGNDFEASESEGANDGSQPGPGMGQSKSSRRRRRKRKNKVAGEGSSAAGGDGESSAPQAVPLVMEGESLALAASAAPQQARRPQGGGQQQGQGQGGKRWKKKFRDRERRPGGGGGGGGRSENPGNDFRAESSSSNGGGYGGGGGYRPDNFGNQAGGFKRKGKGGGQARERGFVGPMDHSYRASGEFGDAPPSTIQLAGPGRRSGHRHTGDSQPIDRSMPRPIPIPEGAQTHIYFFIEELFFQAKIQETAKKLGVKVAFIKNEKDAVAALTEGEENKPALIVFDLNNANAKPLTLIPKLKTKLKRTASIVGFLSHLQGDLKAKAVEAGCDVVMPRAAFSQNLPNLLRRYGVEEAEEVNFNC
jgi:CheY-like chemotaxis protein